MKIIIEMSGDTKEETVRWLATELMRSHTDIMGVSLLSDEYDLADMIMKAHKEATPGIGHG